MHVLHSRLLQLPPHLLYQIQVRLASSASTGPHTQFPFPAHPNPTPYQIFHLPAGASQADIKSRYYDLVRAHHPDSPHIRHLPPSTRHARFQAIRAAYDTLAHKQRHAPAFNSWSGYPYEQQLDIMRRYQWARTAERERRTRAGGGADAGGMGGGGAWGSETVWTASADDRWKDRVIITVGIVSLVVGLSPVIFVSPHALIEQRHLQASANLATARREAREVGRERRREVRRRVRAQQEQLLEEREGRM